MGNARGAVDNDAPLCDRGAELLAQAALSHPGLAEHADDLGLSLAGAGQGVLEHGELLLPAHETDTPGPRGAETGVGAVEDVHPQGLADALDRLAAEVG